MSVTITDFHGQPGPSYGKIQFGRQGDTVALDLDNSRQHSFSLLAGRFYASHSLIERPGYRDWINLNLPGVDSDALIDSQNALPLGLIKWIRFELREYTSVAIDGITELPSTFQNVPTVYFRNMKNTRVVIRDSESLTLNPVGTDIEFERVETLGIPEGQHVDITRTQLDFNWFDGDDLTRYYASTDDSAIVSVSYEFKSKQRFPGDVIDAVRITAEGAVGQTATVSIRALDAAGNEVTAHVVITIT